MEELSLDMIIEAQLQSLEAQCAAIRMILMLKGATEKAAAEVAEVPSGPIPRVQEDDFVMPPTFRGKRD